MSHTLYLLTAFRKCKAWAGPAGCGSSQLPLCEGWGAPGWCNTGFTSRAAEAMYPNIPTPRPSLPNCHWCS